MFKSIRAAIAALLSVALVIPTAFAQQGYRTVTGERPTGDPNVVEVTEFFWYGCPHCYNFEPLVRQWKQDLPTNVEFRYVPAVFSPTWELHARAFYAAKVTGVLDQFHAPMFEALNEENRNLGSEKAIKRFVSSRGIDEQQFAETMDSFAVDAKIRQSRDLQQTYGISGTPSVVIDGSYVTSGSMAGSFERMIEVMSERVAKARANLGSSDQGQ